MKGGIRDAVMREVLFYPLIALQDLLQRFGAIHYFHIRKLRGCKYILIVCAQTVDGHEIIGAKIFDPAKKEYSFEQRKESPANP